MRQGLLRLSPLLDLTVFTQLYIIQTEPALYGVGAPERSSSDVRS